MYAACYLEVGPILGLLTQNNDNASLLFEKV